MHVPEVIWPTGLAVGGGGALGCMMPECPFSTGAEVWLCSCGAEAGMWCGWGCMPFGICWGWGSGGMEAAGMDEKGEGAAVPIMPAFGSDCRS